VAATEADTLGQAVWETVGDRERTVSVATGEGVPAFGLAVPKLLPVPPPVELSSALGEGRAVEDKLAEGEDDARGERVAVVDCERKVSVARMEAETLRVAGAVTEALVEGESEAVVV
jgi:hypothetical protein